MACFPPSRRRKRAALGATMHWARGDQYSSHLENDPAARTKSRGKKRMRCPFEVRRGTLARSLEAYERRRQAARDRHLSLQAPTRRTQNPGTSPLDSQGGMRRLARRRVEDEAYADDLVHQSWLTLLGRSSAFGAGRRGFLASVLRRLPANLDHSVNRPQWPAPARFPRKRR